MDMPTEEHIRERAHQLWEIAGKPYGREARPMEKAHSTDATPVNTLVTSVIPRYQRTL